MPADDIAWLKALVARSPLLDATLREHWQRVLEWLPPPARQELADILTSIECS
jgi:hypothetical protein